MIPMPTLTGSKFAFQLRNSITMATLLTWMCSNRIIDACVDAYRDRLLNDLPEFDKINPSIEHFCRRFFERFTTALGSNRLKRVAIRIWENELAWAAYEESF
jgi:6-pyruvoyl-tetrahydropterin synthase